MLGILEANIPLSCHPPSLQIDGYWLEMDSHHKAASAVRTAVFIRKGTQYRRRRDLEPARLPVVCIEMNENKKKPWLVWTGYREWEASDKLDDNGSKSQADQLIRLERMTQAWQRARRENKPLIVLGDFNVDVQPWLHPEAPLSDYQASQRQLLSNLRDAAAEANLVLTPTGHTRIQGADNASTLDLILTSKPELISNIRLLATCSDHALITCQVSQVKPPPIKRSRRFRGFKKYSKDGLLAAIDYHRLGALLWSEDPNWVAEELTSILNLALDVVAPTKTVNPRKGYVPHLTAETKLMMKERDILRSTFIKDRTLAKEAAYKILKREVVRRQLEDKRAWGQALFEGTEANSKKL